QIKVGGNPNETTLRFDHMDNLYALVRREAGDRMGILAKSEFPYKNWTYEKLSVRLGGPNFLIPDRAHLIIGTRYYREEGASTALLTTDLQGKIKDTLILPSGGDTSYPGMIIYKKRLWVVYYSSHEGKSSIYLTQIPIKN